MTSPEAYQALALSLGLGLLVGLQRQREGSPIAGIRSFPLVTLMGTLAVVIGGELLWVVIAGLVCLASLLIIGNVIKLSAGEFDPGITTEVAVLLMFLVGAATGMGIYGPAIVITGIVALLLYWKQSLHGWIARLADRDLRGLFHWVLIALVILPVLPDRAYGPYQVLNPFEIWRMVVLIVGISLGAYVLQRMLGQRVGGVLSGVLGGLISSTATTLSYARRTVSNPAMSSLAALVIMLASTVVNLRILIEIGVVAPQLLPAAAPPILLVFVLMLSTSVVLFFLQKATDPVVNELEDPGQLKSAIILGALYALVLFLVAVTAHHLGDRALYGLAALSGLTDVDAITLSTARLFESGEVVPETAWRVILVATMSNLAFKLGAVALLGSRRLTRHMLVVFGVALVGTTAVLLFWPNIEVPVAWFETGRP